MAPTYIDKSLRGQPVANRSQCSVRQRLRLPKRASYIGHSFFYESD